MDSSTPVNESMASVLSAMKENLPGVIRAITGVQPEVAQAQADIDAAVSPQYANTQVQLYDQQGRELNRIGSEIETANQLAASAREAQIAQEYGPTLVKAADELNRLIDPEFYKNRTEISDKLSSLVGSVDPTQLSGSERAEVERALARSGGNVNPNSASQTVANAMTFGQALQNKQSQAAGILGTAAGAAPALRSGYNAFEVATRRALTPNTGDVKFLGTQQGTGQNAWQTGNNMMAQASNLAAINAQKKESTLDGILKGTQAFSNLAGSFSFA